MSLSRLLTATALLALPSLAGAATLTWPGAAPCDGSLQACIDAATPADTVQIARNTPIDEAILITKSLQLRAAPGWSPMLTRTLELQVPNLSPGSAAEITVEGITLFEAGLRVTHAASTTARVILRGNTIRSVPAAGSWFNAAALNVTTVSPNGLDLDVLDNLIDARLLVPGNTGHAGIRIMGEGSGELTGFIARNRILMQHAPSAAAIGIERHAGSSNLRIGLNRIEGSDYGHGIRFRAEDSESASHIVAVYNNVVIGQKHHASGAAIVLETTQAELLSQVLSNTLTHGQRGLLTNGTAGIQLANNLFAYNDEDVLIAPASEVAYLNNLSHGNGTSRLIGTPGLVTGSPRLAFDGFRLRPGSAAIDAASDDVGMSPMDFVDIDGLPRLKGAFMDIGAHESGARHLLHRASPGNTVLHASEMRALQGEVAANPLLTQNWNPGGIGGTYNNQPVGVYYAEGLWRVFNENIAPMPAGAAFNVFAPGSATPGHLSAPANTFDGASLIDREGLTDNPDAFVLATHHWNGHGSPGQYMDTRWGIAYLGGYWTLIALEAPFPHQRGFNLHMQQRSGSAFLHVSDAGNITANWTTIDHPLLNGTPCALLQVTPRTDGSFAPSQQLGVWYTGSRWAVFHQGSATMPAGVQMHVLFDPAQVEGCSRERIFADGVEDRPPRPW